MKPIIVANWKCNPVTAKEAEKIFNSVKEGIKDAMVEAVICPPFVFLPLLKGVNLGAPASPSLGGQNVFYEEKGAFTGEISPLMLKDLGVEYVIIGHSERRKYFGDSDEEINKKVKKSLEAGLKIIFCIGETDEEREMGKKEDTLERQLKIGLFGIKNVSNINIAYEPVWAIGTGNNCSVEDTRESIEFIKKLAPKGIKVLYGGSVKSQNAGAYVKEAKADGLLVGGASLDSEEFVKIIKSIS